MTIHTTNIIIHGCRVHLEPTGPEPSDAEQRLRHEVSMASSADNVLRGILSGITAVAKPPRLCQHCRETVMGGAFVIVGGGVMHHECFAEALSNPKKPADRIAELQHELAREKEAHSTACGLVARMHAAAVGEIRGPSRGVVEDVEDLRADAERLRHVASENGKSCLQLHNETKSLRASLQAMAEQSATYMRERDEARQMHKERVFWEKAALNDQIAVLGERLTKLRVAAQAIIDKQAPYFRELVDDLRKAMG